MTFDQIIESSIATLRKSTNNKALNKGMKEAAEAIRLFGEVFRDQVYSKTEIVTALVEARCQDDIGDFVYVKDLLDILAENKKASK